MTVKLDQLDHLVLTVADIQRTIAFYTRILGMEEVTFGTRKALQFGNQQINLHQRGHEFEPKAGTAVPSNPPELSKSSLGPLPRHHRRHRQSAQQNHRGQQKRGPGK